MSTSEFLHLMIIFCILLRRNTYILKQLSKTFQKSTFSSHLCSWVQGYVRVFSLFPVSVVWCKGELRNWAPAVSGNEKERLQAPHGWDTGIMHCQHWDPSRHFQLWKPASSCGKWWKCSGESWGADHHTSERWGWWSHHIIALSCTNCSPRGLATAAQEDCSREVHCTCRSCAQGSFLAIVPSCIVSSASSLCKCSICKGRCSMAGCP